MLKDIFYQTMAREAKTIYTLDDTPVEVFFRKNSDKNSATERMTIFYDADSPLYAGQTIIFRDRRYLLLNKETPENSVYQKSNMLLADTFCVIPFETEDITFNAVLVGSNKIRLSQTSQGNFFEGGLELLTSPSCEVEKLLKTGDYRLITDSNIYKFLGSFEDNGILHISIEQVNESVTFETSIVGASTLKPKETTHFTLQKTASYNGVTYPLKPLNAIFTSDNENIITITPTGDATALIAGTATVTATFQSGTYTLLITVQDALKQVLFEPSIVDERGATLTKINTPITLKMRLIEPSGEPVTAEAEFSVLDKDYRVVPADFTLAADGNSAVFTRKTWWDFLDMFIKVQARIIYQNVEYAHVWDVRATESYM